MAQAYPLVLPFHNSRLYPNLPPHRSKTSTRSRLTSNRVVVDRSIKSRSLAWYRCFRTVWMILMVRMLFHAWRFHQDLHHLCYRLQMTLSHSVSRKAHHARVLQPPARYFPPLPLPPPRLLPRPPYQKRQQGHYQKTQTGRTNGKVLEVHAATGITHPRSDHLDLGIRSSFCLRRQQGTIRRGDALVRIWRLRPHRRLLPVASPLMNQPPPVPLPMQPPVLLT